MWALECESIKGIYLVSTFSSFNEIYCGKWFGYSWLASQTN